MILFCHVISQPKGHVTFWEGAQQRKLPSSSLVAIGTMEVNIQ